MTDQLFVIGHLHHVGGEQRRMLAGAVPHHGIRTDLEPFKQRIERLVGAEDRFGA